MVRRRLLPLSTLLLTLLFALPAEVQAMLLEPEIQTETPVERLHIVFPQDPDATWFLDTFGARRASGRVHLGVDLHAPKGSPLYAVASGIVTRLGSSRRAGMYLVVDHGSGWTSWYMHLDNDRGRDDGRGGFETAFAPGVEEGSYVDAGQLIGFVGDSGNAEGTVPHTHLEIHRDGRAIDPYRMLVQAQQRAMMVVRAERAASLSSRLN